VSFDTSQSIFVSLEYYLSRLNATKPFRTIERVFAREHKFRRLLLRFERICDVNYALKLKMLAYTMINLQHYCRN
jgi:hypothetical protein